MKTSSVVRDSSGGGLAGCEIIEDDDDVCMHVWGGGIEWVGGRGSTCKQSLNSGKRSPREATTGASNRAAETTTTKRRRWPLSSEERGSSRMAREEEQERAREAKGENGKRRTRVRLTERSDEREAPRATVCRLSSPLQQHHRPMPALPPSPNPAWSSS